MELSTRSGFKYIIDDEDFERVSAHQWSKIAKGYIGGGSKGKVIYLHRFIMSAPKGMDVDHINGDRTDNRKSNLRICTRSQNLANIKSARKNRSSKYKGVTFYKRDRIWIAQIAGSPTNNGYIGRFESEEIAARAYDKKARELYGEYAATNFSD